MLLRNDTVVEVEAVPVGACRCRPKMSDWPGVRTTSSISSRGFVGEEERFRLLLGEELAATVDVEGVNARAERGKRGILNSGLGVERRLLGRFREVSCGVMKGRLVDVDVGVIVGVD